MYLVRERVSRLLYMWLCVIYCRGFSFRKQLPGEFTVANAPISVPPARSSIILGRRLVTSHPPTATFAVCERENTYEVAREHACENPVTPSRVAQNLLCKRGSSRIKFTFKLLLFRVFFFLFFFRLSLYILIECNGRIIYDYARHCHM